MKMRLVFPAAIAIALTLVSAISFARAAEVRVGDLAITAAWARATPPGAEIGAAYLVIENRGGGEDRIISATSAVAQAVELHETVEENGMARMRPLAPVLPAGGRLEMRPGGAHLMLIGLPKPLREGDEVSVTLTFATAGAITVDLPVAAIGADSPPGAGHQH